MTTYPLKIHDAAKEKPPEWKTVIVQGGIAWWTGERWETRVGHDSGRPIEWTVEWWAEVPSFTRRIEPKVSAEIYGGLV